MTRGPGLLSLEQEQLLAEEGDFEVFGPIIPAPAHDQVEYEYEDLHEDRPEHFPSQVHGFPSAYHPPAGSTPTSRHPLTVLHQP